MRKIVTGAFVSLDGVMQAPGGPEEDPTGGFRFGGWTAPFWNDAIGAALGESFAASFDLLLGRRTYDIFAAHWPHVVTDPQASGFDALNGDIAKRFNAITKYVATHRPESLGWQNSRGLGDDVVRTVRELKSGDGPTSSPRARASSSTRYSRTTSSMSSASSSIPWSSDAESDSSTRTATLARSSSPSRRSLRTVW